MFRTIRRRLFKLLLWFAAASVLLVILFRWIPPPGTMLMVEALVQANKQFDWAIYPDKNHGIYGGKTRLQLFTKMTNFINDKL